MNYLLIIFFLFFTYLVYKNFRLAVEFFIILLPTYLIRFNIGPFPTTLLEVYFFGLFIIWLIKFAREDIKKIQNFLFINSKLLIIVGIFLISSIIAIFVSGDIIPALGIWRAYFLEPMILFFILVGRFPPPLYKGRNKEGYIGSHDLIWALAISTLSISIYSIFQKFTGYGISTPEWTAEATRRVIAFFSSPNAVGLYLAPILILMVAYLWLSFPRRFCHSRESDEPRRVSVILANAGIHNHGLKTWIPAFAGMTFIAIFSLLALYFTKSQGAWIGLGAGLLAFIFLIGYKKIAWVVVILGIMLSLIIPSLRSTVLFQDRAGQNRLILWNQSWNYLTQSPTHFIFGAGLRQFYDKIQKPTHDWKVIERHIYPHNIFLNFWTEIGLLGILSFSMMLFYLFYLSWKIRKKDLVFGSGLFAVLTVILVHGLVDVPYFKNDLVMLWWIIVAIIVNYYCYCERSETKRSSLV